MKPLYIDNSTLRATARCDTEAVLRYVLDYTTQDESAVLKSGTAGHEALAEYFRGQDIDTCLDALEKEYRAWADEHVPPGDRLSFENLRDVVEHWIESHPRAELPFAIPSPDFVEVAFKYPLDTKGEIVLTGRMDAIVRDTEADLAPMDNKFTGRMDQWWAASFKNDSQMSGYMWVAGQHVGQRLTKGYINAVELAPGHADMARKCRVHAVPYAECGNLHRRSMLILITRTPQQLEEWRVTAIKLAKRFRRLKELYPTIDQLPKVPMQGMFHQACARCNFATFCSSGRPLQMIDTVLRKEKWNPLDSYNAARAKHEEKP